MMEKKQTMSEEDEPKVGKHAAPKEKSEIAAIMEDAFSQDFFGEMMNGLEGEEASPEPKTPPEESDSRLPEGPFQQAAGPEHPSPVASDGKHEDKPHRERFTRAQLSHIRAGHAFAVRLFVGILAVGFLIGLLFFLRPSTSDLEKRELTPFPEFTLEGFLDGSFLSDVSLWYSDTYPLREPLVNLDQSLKHLYGIQTETMMIGGKVQAEEVPPEEEEPEKPKNTRPQVDVPTEEQMAAEVQNQIMSGLYVKNGAAYSIYYFSKDSVQAYADAINTCADELEGSAQVYSLLVPTNSAVMLPESEVESLGGTNQQKAIDYFYSLMNDNVRDVQMLQTLRNHNSEYIYFRTDHHWTTLGAYYAYLEFCAEKGIEPADLAEFKQMEFAPFLGTFYSETNNNPQMAANPDTVKVYVPSGTNETTYWDKDGIEHKGKVIEDVSTWASGTLYNTFIDGDNPLTKIVNPEITDGSCCMLVKDSFGNAFVPYLVDTYETVYVVDFRYSSMNLVDFAKENGVQDVIFLNNLSLAGNQYVAAKIDSMLYPTEGSEGGEGDDSSEDQSSQS